MRGVVRWFDAKKGYGFITPDEGNEDIFVHFSAIQMTGYRKLDEGQAVEVEFGKDERGRFKATSVIPVNEAPYRS